MNCCSALSIGLELLLVCFLKAKKTDDFKGMIIMMTRQQMKKSNFNH